VNRNVVLKHHFQFALPESWAMLRGERRMKPTQFSKNWARTIHVIHLSKATQRKRTFRALNRINGIHFEFMEGVDSNYLDFSELKRRNLIKPKTTFRTPGCGLAHRKLWVSVLQAHAPLIVCEDDAVIRFSRTVFKMHWRIASRLGLSSIGIQFRLIPRRGYHCRYRALFGTFHK
jgi:Glycosyltransferase family 25 (LPS biosynthesis protein)